MKRVGFGLLRADARKVIQELETENSFRVTSPLFPIGRGAALLAFQFRRQTPVEQALAERQELFPRTGLDGRFAFGMNNNAQLFGLLMAVAQYGYETLDHPVEGVDVIVKDNDVGRHITAGTVVYQDVFFFFPLRLGQGNCGMRNTEYGMRNTECGMRSAEYGVRNTEYGMRSAEYGMRSAECLPLLSVAAWPG